MAAYAALVSVINIMDHIRNHPRFSSSLDKNQTEFLEKKICFLLDFIETAHSHGVISKEAQALESQIARAAYAAEDVIESHIVDQIHSASVSLLDLQAVIHEIEFFKEKIINVKEARRIRGPQLIRYESSKSSASTSLKLPPMMVGFDQELTQLMDALTGQDRALKIIPIVGMGGIGKTTLARNAYDNPFIVHHFHLRAWATISHNYSVREIFSKLLSCQSYNKSTSELDGETEDELAQKMYQSLVGRKYFIILDDVWGIRTWEGMKRFFPDNRNGSRIVVTTRLSSLAIHLRSYCLSMKFLNEENSWNLFCQKAFPEEGCPPELEEVGKKIAKNCKGLPLLICVIGALVRNSSLRQEYWENVSKDINSIPKSKEDEQRLDILSLSYSYLPAHLKPCFLYMCCFPENHEIRVSQLVKLWVAEGFLRPNKSQSLEEVAMGYLKDLIDRNFIFVRRLGSNGKITTCGIHDLLRDLCLKAAHKEKFLCVMSVGAPGDVQEDRARRIVFHERITKGHHARFDGTLKSASLARSWISNGTWISYKFRLLRVSSNVANRGHLSDLDDTFDQHVNLRFLNKRTTFRRSVVNSSHVLPSSISLLWNLQTLTIRGCAGVTAPDEIWEMRQLRHVEFDQIRLPEPPFISFQKEDDVVVLRSLQTLFKVLDLRLNNEVCKRIPNIKKLKIKYDVFPTGSDGRYRTTDIRHLLKLESLYLRWETKTMLGIPEKIELPSSLKKLTLVGSSLYWEHLTYIGSLPHLQVLKLIKLNPGLGSSEWNPIEGEFRCLKFLGIYYCNELKVWNADKSNFPVLEKLVVHGLSKLEEVPWGVGEIPTLGIIDLDGCSESATISAMRILEEQESLGNYGLEVRIKFWDKAKLDMFREQAEQELGGFTSNNLRLICL